MIRYAVLCPGQGTQAPGLLDRFAGEPAAAEVLAALAATGVGPADLADDARLYANAVAQPLICGFALAAWAMLRPLLPPPTLFAGYSVGELAAYGCAGTFDVAITLALAWRRAALMDAAATTPHAMLSVRGPRSPALRPLLAEHGWAVAIRIAADRHVVAGPAEPVQPLRHALDCIGASVTPLAVRVASHTALMASAAAGFAVVLAETPGRDPAVPVLDGRDGGVVRRLAAARAALAGEIDHALDWGATLESAAERGCTTFLELGPGDHLARMALETLPGVRARSISEFRSWQAVSTWLSA
jgi:[acyl-carrier-protein] S-malonyltransferase